MLIIIIFHLLVTWRLQKVSGKDLDNCIHQTMIQWRKQKVKDARYRHVSPQYLGVTIKRYNMYSSEIVCVMGICSTPISQLCSVQNSINKEEGKGERHQKYCMYILAFQVKFLTHSWESPSFSEAFIIIIVLLESY